MRGAHRSWEEPATLNDRAEPAGLTWRDASWAREPAHGRGSLPATHPLAERWVPAHLIETPLYSSHRAMATTERDFYLVLGVERTATDAEIKRAYRKLAQQWHPDVNADEAAHDRFTEINEAYQVLSDSGAARALRPVRASRAGRRGRGRLRRLRRLQRHLRRVLRWRVGHECRAARRGGHSPAPTCYDLRITFDEAVKGTEKEIEFPVLLRCETCKGSGAQAGHRAHDLPAVQRPRRGPLDPPDDARPDGQRQRLPALPG